MHILSRGVNLNLIMPLGPNNDNPNYIIQVGNVIRIIISIENIISKLQTYKVKVSKVCFEDFLFSEDIVGNFTVDLSTYGDVFAVLKKYKEKIARMTAILPCEGTSLKITFSSKGSVMVYKTRDSFEDDMLDMLHAILLK